MDPVPTFVSLRELSARTGQSVSALKGHAQAGRIPAIKVGSMWRVPTSYLDQLEHDAYDRMAS